MYDSDICTLCNCLFLKKAENYIKNYNNNNNNMYLKSNIQCT